MIKSKFTKTLALGICFTALSSNIALANEGGQSSSPSGQLPVYMVKVDSKQAMGRDKLPVNSPDTPVSDSAQKSGKINDALDLKVINADANISLAQYAQYENKIIKGDKKIGIQVNGQWLQLDVEPRIENDRALIPLRGVMEKLGAKVEWHPEQEMVEVYAEAITIALVVGENTAKIIRNIDGILKEKIIKLEVPAKIVENRTLIPGRFVSETLGAEVRWDNSLRAVIIDTDNISDITKIENLVQSFGEKLKSVSLLAPRDIARKSIQENYSEFVSSSLLAQWQNTPENAPGRLTSSPWPECIEILTIERVSEDVYKVKGEIVEATSTEVINDEVAAKQSIILLVKKDNNRWFIDDVAIGAFYKGM